MDLISSLRERERYFMIDCNKRVCYDTVNKREEGVMDSCRTPNQSWRGEGRGTCNYDASQDIEQTSQEYIYMFLNVMFFEI